MYLKSQNFFNCKQRRTSPSGCCFFSPCSSRQHSRAYSTLSSKTTSCSMASLFNCHRYKDLLSSVDAADSRREMQSFSCVISEKLELCVHISSDIYRLLKIFSRLIFKSSISCDMILNPMILPIRKNVRTFNPLLCVEWKL